MIKFPPLQTHLDPSYSLWPCCSSINPIVLTPSECISSPTLVRERRCYSFSRSQSVDSIKACRAVIRSAGHKQRSVFEALNQHTLARGLNAGVLRPTATHTLTVNAPSVYKSGPVISRQTHTLTPSYTTPT